jgi:hypothetical protein
MPIIMNMEGTPPLTGRALPNLINAVKMLKSKTALVLTLTLILTY